MSLIARARRVALIVLLLIPVAAPASAHVGSPDVFVEGDAGPYHLFVTVRIPQVIPGVAEIEVRSQSADVREVRTTVTTLSGAGSKYAPVPDVARHSRRDPRFFTSSLWLMANGSLQVRVIADGARGRGEMSVPVASFAQRVFAMPRWLGAILLFLLTMLAIGAISIVGAAAREAGLDPGTPPTPQARRRGAIAMAITAALVVTAAYLGYAWWSADARDYAAVVQFFKPPKLAATLVNGNTLVLRPAVAQRLRKITATELIPDHGHLMHLFLIRTAGLDRIWHLHPARQPDGTFVDRLPSLETGHYRIFADVVHKSGFPFTMVGEIDLPAITGAPLAGDDSGGAAPPLTPNSPDSDRFPLPDGGSVVWQRGSTALRANAPLMLRFVVEDKSGRPASDLEPYMGMAAHAEIVRDDFSVFAHIHPTGSVPMAALMLARSDSGPPSAMAGMLAPQQKVAPEISLPYGFPQPGLYRIFLQFKRRGRIENAAFDAHVAPASTPAN